MQEDFLYQHMPDAEQKLNDAVKPLAHQPSPHCQKRMERLFAPKKTHTGRKWLTVAAAAVIVVSLSVIPWQAQSVRGSDGMIHREVGPYGGTVLQLDESVQTLPAEMRILPQTIAGKYTHRQERTPEWEARFRTYNSRSYKYLDESGDPASGFRISQDGLGGNTYSYWAAPNDWKHMVVDGYNVYYAVIPDLNDNSKNLSYAYWFEDNCMIDIHGGLNEPELLEVIEDLFRQKK